MAKQVRSLGFVRSQVDSHLRGEDCPAPALAAAIRHIFLHGPLTPNAKEARPDDVKIICDRLSRALVTMMDREFSNRVADLVEAVP